MDLFRDIIPSIMQTKQNVLVTEEDEKSYVPFIINRALSKHLDTVLFANEMNKLSWLDKAAQYDYLLNTVRAYKRPFKKWDKYAEPENLDSVIEYYECSHEVALGYLQLLTGDQIQQIKKKLEKGGVNNARKYDRSKTKSKK